MHQKTKIVVLHMKELIYTGIFVLLGILFIILLVLMCLPKYKENTTTTETASATYVPVVASIEKNTTLPTLYALL